MEQLRQWWQALRPFSFPASIFPSLTGSLAAAVFHGTEPAFGFSVTDALLTVVGCVAIHATSNLLNDFFDWRSGLDRRENSGRMNPLVQGTLSARQILMLALGTAAIAIGIGIVLVRRTEGAILWIIAVGAVSTWAYTAPPFALKYRALGEVQVMLSFGVLMTLGSYVVQAARCANLESESAVVLLSLPQSLLIAAILHANNHRDRRGDRTAGAQTLSLLVGSAERSAAVGRILVWSAYVVHLLVVIATAGERYAVPVWTLLALLSMPLARQALGLLDGSDDPSSPQFGAVVPMHARVQMAYGGLMVVGLALGALGQ